MSAAGSLGQIGVQIVADTTGLNAALAQSVLMLKRFATEMVEQSIVSINAGAKLADRLSEDFNSVRALEYAGQRTGASMAQMDQVLQRMTLNLGKAALGGKQSAEVFHKFGLDINDLVKKGPIEQFQKIADVLSKIKSPAEQMAAAVALIGVRGAQGLGPVLTLLQQSGFTIKQLIDEYNRFHGVIGREDAAGVEMLWNSWKKVELVVSGIIDKLVSKISPAISAAIDALLTGFNAGDMNTFWDSVFHNSFVALDWMEKKIKEIKGLAADIAQVAGPGVRAAGGAVNDAMPMAGGIAGNLVRGMGTSISWAARFAQGTSAERNFFLGQGLYPGGLGIKAAGGLMEEARITAIQDNLIAINRTRWNRPDGALGGGGGGFWDSVLGNRVFAPSGSGAGDDASGISAFRLKNPGDPNFAMTARETAAVLEQSRIAENARQKIKDRSDAAPFGGAAVGFAQTLEGFAGSGANIGAALNAATKGGDIGQIVSDPEAHKLLGEIEKNTKGPPKAG